jgi:hypothetical protein
MQPVLYFFSTFTMNRGLLSYTGCGQDGRPDNDRAGYVVAAFEKSLKRRGVYVIDLYHRHHLDPNDPVEGAVGAMAGLVAEGKSAPSVCRKSQSQRCVRPTPFILSPRCNPNTAFGTGMCNNGQRYWPLRLATFAAIMNWVQFIQKHCSCLRCQAVSPVSSNWP